MKILSNESQLKLYFPVFTCAAILLTIRNPINEGRNINNKLIIIQY